MVSRVLFLLPYPQNQAPSQRFRVEAYFSLLKANNISFDVDEFLSDKAWKILYRQGSILQKGGAVLKGFLKRFYILLFRAVNYQYIFIHREAAPLGPPFFEWFIAKVLRKKIIYDFDDAIWIPNVTESNKLARLLKCFWKVKWICRWSYKVSAGNEYLANYALQYNRNVVYNPTCVDTESKYNTIAPQQRYPVVIGWTGSHSTIQFLAEGIPALQELEKKEKFKFLTICDKKPPFNLLSLEFKPWNSQTEIADLLQMNIGIMPLKTDAWSEGKCGFKLIQYMALGIPALASPVGVNKKIIEHGENGYLCATDEEWVKYLMELLNDEKKRAEFGQKGRAKILKEYSIASNSANFLSLFSN